MELSDILPPQAFREQKRTDQFAPKLEFEDRCAILALLRAGIRRPLLSAVFNVDRRTVGHIGNTASPHYKDVRKERERLGEVAFREKYLTETVLAKVKAVAEEYQPPEENRPNPATNPHEPSRRAAGKSGINTVKPDQCRYSHRLDIQWRGLGEAYDDSPAGWYYRDLDSSDTEAWLHNGDESRKTSHSCLAEAVANLTDD